MHARIINGEAAGDPWRFPYAAWLGWHVTPNSTSVCGATLITPRHLLTAAHCVAAADGSAATPDALRASLRGQRLEVSAVEVHEDYAALTNLDRSGPSNDIALLTLAHPAAGAPTAALPDPAAAAAVPSPGQRVWAAGWGLTEDGTASAALRYTDLRVLGEGEGGGKAFADNFVAGGTAGYTCQGDSGGPVVQPGATTGGADTLVGITSWGDQDCCVPFSFYVRVADHARWLAARLAAAAASGDGSGGGEGDCGLPASTQEWVTRVLQLR